MKNNVSIRRRMWLVGIAAIAVMAVFTVSARQTTDPQAAVNAAIEKRIGVDATGMRFNSIVAVEMAQKLLGGPELNPLVNPGAITTTSMVQGASADAVWGKIIGTYNDFAGRNLSVLQDVYKSEAVSYTHLTLPTSDL